MCLEIPALSNPTCWSCRTSWGWVWVKASVPDCPCSALHKSQPSKQPIRGGSTVLEQSSSRHQQILRTSKGMLCCQRAVPCGVRVPRCRSDRPTLHHLHPGGAHGGLPGVWAHRGRPGWLRAGPDSHSRLPRGPCLPPVALTPHRSGREWWGECSLLHTQLPPVWAGCPR